MARRSNVLAAVMQQLQSLAGRERRGRREARRKILRFVTSYVGSEYNSTYVTVVGFHIAVAPKEVILYSRLDLVAKA